VSGAIDPLTIQGIREQFGNSGSYDRFNLYDGVMVSIPGDDGGDNLGPQAQEPPSGEKIEEDRDKELVPVRQNAAMIVASIEEKFDQMFKSPIVLKDQEIGQYLSGKIQGKKFYIRKLDPTADMRFIDQWKSDLSKDTEWQKEWAKKGFYADRLPRFEYFSELSFGLFSETASGPKLEGFIGIGPDAVKHVGGILAYKIFIPQMEVYYRNIKLNGKRDINGVSDLLFDLLIKFCGNPDNKADQGITFYPITPGSEEFAHRRDLQMIDRHAVLTAEQIKGEYTDRHLDKLFNGNQAMTAEGGIDLTPANMKVQVKTGSPTNAFGDDNEGIKFHLDPAQLAQLQNSPGFEPVIFDVEELTDLPAFLGLQKSKT